MNKNIEQSQVGSINHPVVENNTMKLAVNTKENILFYSESGVGEKVLIPASDLVVGQIYLGFAHVQGDRKRLTSFLRPLEYNQCQLFKLHYSKFIESGANLKDEGYRLICEGLSRNFFKSEDNELYHLTPGGIIGFLIYTESKGKPVMIREYSTVGLRYLVFDEVLKRTEECAVERCHEFVVRYTKTKFLQSNVLPNALSNESFLTSALASYFSYSDTSREAKSSNFVSNRILEYENTLYLPKDGHLYVGENNGATIGQEPLRLNRPFVSGQLADMVVRNGDLSTKLLTVSSGVDLVESRKQRALLLKNFLTLGFQELLLKISRGNVQIILALRTAIARVLLAGDIGDKLQTGFWFYGPPRTGKSLAQKIIAMFGNAEIVSGNITNFSTDTYKSASVIIFPDILNFTSEQLQLLRRLLGRDPLKSERKYQQGSLTYVSKATVIITSNRHPNDLKSLNYEEYRDKLVFVPFNQAVREDEIDANLIHKITHFKEEFLMWALTTPKVFLDKQVRAEEYYQLVGRPKDGGDDVFDEFIQSTLYTIDPNWKCPQETKIISDWEDGEINYFTNKTCIISKNALKNLYEEWCKDVLRERHDTKGFYTKFKNTLNSARYRLNITESRPSSEGNGPRPRVFNNIIYPTTAMKESADKGLNNLIPVRSIKTKSPIDSSDLLEQALFGMDPDLGGALLDRRESYQQLLEFKYDSELKLNKFLKDTVESSQETVIPWYNASASYSSEEETTSPPPSELQSEPISQPEVLVPSSTITDEEILQEDIATFMKRKGLNKIKAPRGFIRKNETKKFLTKEIRQFISRFEDIRDYIL